ncbi:MAG TPA: DUF5777 family beta-barrel protein [Chitinophagaceae bacterium]|nr:DUF5777 family beta-barrel protein [Chitinophagaceae bacterium]
MKLSINTARSRFAIPAGLLLCLLILGGGSWAQEDTTAATEQVTEEPELPAKPKPVKNTFQSVWIIDNQTVMVPVKGTLEMDIMHRFGTVNKGYKDFWGFFAPSNIRLGLSYSPINKLNLGFGITKSNMLWDASAKYSIITQTPKQYPVSVTYYGNVAYDTRNDADKSIFRYSTQRVSFFNQLIIARKINDKLSVQVAPSHSHQNAVDGFYTKNDSTGQETFKNMKHDHFAVSFAARYKLTNVTSLIFNFDQPLTKHATNNPNPNLAFGVEFNTSSHSFQLFFGNYFYLNQQRNNLYNTNSPFAYDDPTKTHPERQTDNPDTPKDESVRVKGGRFLIGFNITRLWNY